jgi:hypothetical protein
MLHLNSINVYIILATHKSSIRYQWGATIAGATVRRASVSGEQVSREQLSGEQLSLGSKCPGSKCQGSKCLGSNRRVTPINNDTVGIFNFSPSPSHLKKFSFLLTESASNSLQNPLVSRIAHLFQIH